MGDVPPADSPALLRSGGGVLVLGAALGLAATVLVGGALVWDGSFYLFNLVRTQHLQIYFSRAAVAPLQTPALLLVKAGAPGEAVRLVFSACYALIPFLSLLTSFLLVRRRVASLLVWPALGIGLVMLPIAMYQVSETVIVGEVFWPLLLATLLGMERAGAVVGVATAVILFLLPGVGVLGLSVVAVAAGVVAWRQPDKRMRMTAWAVLLAVAIPVRIVPLHADFERNVVSLHQLRLELVNSGFGAVVAVAGALVIGALLLASRRGVIVHRTARLLAWVALAAVGAVLVVWAVQAGAWAREYDYRDFALIATVPLAVMATLDALGIELPAVSLPQRTDRARIVAATGVIFAAVLGVQALTWHRITDGLGSRLAASSSLCVSPAMATQRDSAIDMWALPSLAVDVQGRSASHLVASDSECTAALTTGIYRSGPFVRARLGTGWLPPAPPRR